LLRTVIGGAVVAVIAGVLAIVGPSIGLDTLWPFLFAAAVALASGPAIASRVGALALGAVVAFVTNAIYAGFVPQTSLTRALMVVLGVGLLTVAAALTGGLLPLWAGLAGYALFAGYYGPTYADSPTTFAADAPVALVTVLLAAGVGAIVAILAELAGVSVGGSEKRAVGTGEVA
jgi:hypothetical protein